MEALELTGETPYLCECGNERCATPILMTRDEYEAVRAHPARFLVLDGHETPGTEAVVERTSRYVVVEKTGMGRAIAERESPR